MSLRKIGKRLKESWIKLVLYFFAIMVCLPVLVVAAGSFMSNYELGQQLYPVTTNTEGFISWHWIPDYPTLKHYIKMLLFRPEFLTVFWNSIKLSFCILLGQLLVALPAAWAFAVYPFRFRKTLFTLYIVLMLMPFQVTMLSSYLVLNAIGSLDSHSAIILPAVFSTFPVFLMYRGFRGIPAGLLEAARIDGANELTLFFRVGVPMGSTGILSAMVLGFLEYWNLIEQPLAFLKDKSLWPISLFLPNIGLESAGYSFAASLITLIPPLFVFAMGQDYLEKGIVASALKE